MQAHDEPSAWLLDMTEVYIVLIEEVVGLEIHQILGLLPRQTGIDKGIWMVVLYDAIKVGVLSHTVLPTEVRTKSKTCEQWYLRIGYQLMAQIFQRILRNDIRLLLLSAALASKPVLFTFVWFTLCQTASSPIVVSMIQSIMCRP